MTYTDLILRSGHLAASRRMDACTLVVIVRDARKSALLRMRRRRLQSLRNTIDAIQPVISAMKAVTNP
jgi:hypothetical protein